MWGVIGAPPSILDVVEGYGIPFRRPSPCPRSSSLFRRFRRHLSPPFVVRHLSPPDSSCPVASLEDLLRSRDAMGVRHAYVFSSSAPPHDPISVSSFSGLLRWAFQRAGISAPPGSTRAISVSDAVARGVSVEEALRAGDWSGAGTFYRHYLRPSGSTVAA